MSSGAAAAVVVVVKERLFRTNAVNEEDPERDRATQV